MASQKCGVMSWHRLCAVSLAFLHSMLVSLAMRSMARWVLQTELTPGQPGFCARRRFSISMPTSSLLNH